MAVYSIKQLKINVAPRAIFKPRLALCDFMISDLFSKMIKNSVIKGITNGLSACEAIKIQIGFPPSSGTIRPDNATNTTIILNNGLFISRGVPE